MINEERRPHRLLLIVLTVAIIIISTILPASAATYTAPVYEVSNDGTLTKITFIVKYDGDGVSDRHNVVIPDSKNGIKITKIASNVVLKNNTCVYSVTIPAGVKSVEANAFTECKNLTKVTINNYEGGLNVSSNSFPTTAKIIYTQEKPTAAPSLQTVVPQTSAHKSNVATTRTTTPNTTRKSTTKTTTKKATTTTEEVATQATTEPATEIVTESTPFASAKAELSDMNVWDQLVNQTTETASNPSSVKNPVLNTASYAAVVVVAFSAIVLGYLKFKK